MVQERELLAKGQVFPILFQKSYEHSRQTRIRKHLKYPGRILSHHRGDPNKLQKHRYLHKLEKISARKAELAADLLERGDRDAQRLGGVGEAHAETHPLLTCKTQILHGAFSE